MDTYGIAALSMGMSAAKVQQQAGVAVLKNVMDSQEQISSKLIEAISELPVGQDMSQVNVLV